MLLYSNYYYYDLSLVPPPRILTDWLEARPNEEGGNVKVSRSERGSPC